MLLTLANLRFLTKYRLMLKSFALAFLLIIIAPLASFAQESWCSGNDRVRIVSPEIYVHATLGNDENCGSEENPMQTLQGAINLLYQRIDAGGGQAKVILLSDVVGRAAFYGQPTGTNFFTIESSTGRYKITAPTNSTFVITFGDNAEFGLRNVEIDSTQTGVNTALVDGHQDGILDTFEGVVLTGKAGDTDIRWDSLGQANINAGLTFRGSRYKVFDFGPQSVLNFNGALVSDSASCGGQIFTIWHHAFAALQGNVDMYGAWSGNCRKFYVAPGGILRNVSGDIIPGSIAGYVDNAGLYLTN